MSCCPLKLPFAIQYVKGQQYILLPICLHIHSLFILLFFTLFLLLSLRLFASIRPTSVKLYGISFPYLTIRITNRVSHIVNNNDNNNNDGNDNNDKYYSPFSSRLPFSFPQFHRVTCLFPHSC